jgi:type II secretory pathway pseudopilin PulG
MILAIGVIVLITALASVGTALSTRDLHGASQAQQAGSALDAAEAGLAQAVSYIRNSGTRKLACYPATCTTNPWNPTNPVSADLKGGGRWTAWIKPESIGNGDDGDRYLIHSTGTAGGPAERTIETEVTVAPIDLPRGIFGRTINLGGTVDLEQISIFTTGCVYKRDKVTSHYSAGLDAAYNVPIGVHSSQIITESQGSGQYCSDTNKPIHGGLNLAGLSLKPCNSAYPYDQDRFGGSLTDLPILGGLLSLVPCAGASALSAYAPRDINLDGKLDVNGSFIRDDASLFRTFGITRPALTDAQIEQLKITAQAQGNYYTSTTGWSVPDGTANPHAVLFFDLS